MTRTITTVDDALALAREVHAEQKDKAGRPYIEHVERVVKAVREFGEEHAIVAALHDTVEDTDVTLDKLAAMGASPAVVAAVDALTKRPGEAYEDAVRRAAANPIARDVKLADNRDNSDEARLQALPNQEKAAELRAKYARAREILLGA